MDRRSVLRLLVLLGLTTVVVAMIACSQVSRPAQVWSAPPAPQAGATMQR